MVIHRFLAALACCGATAVAAAGCYDYNCERLETCPVIDATEAPLAECTDPTTRPDDGCGVFVSASMGDDENPGTRARPVRTIHHALQITQDEHRVVYACAEVFAEVVMLPSGFALVGGLDCANGWHPIGALEKTELVGEAGEIPLTLLPGTGQAQVLDVRVRAVDAVEAGGSSIAVLARDGAEADLIRCDLLAGNGADGDNGEPGDPEHPKARSGAPGLMGATACTTEAPAGGGFVKTDCDDGLVSAGGLGGNGGPTAGGSGTDGTPAPAPNPEGYGTSGAGESSDGVDPTCLAGTNGANGRDGVSGRGGTGVGKVEQQGYAGRSGEEGEHGLPGQGGGGGGGARAGVAFCGNKPKGGAGGGSGGSGGCGGRGGKGGQYGGASIGIAIGAAAIRLLDVVIATSNGGRGGTGGMFQIGGPGGVEGQGGQGVGGSKIGCAGGEGGQGGNGGFGGGGLGGPSVGVAHTQNLPSLESVFVQLGKPGKGGIGGNPNVDEAIGADGVVAESVWMPDTP